MGKGLELGGGQCEPSMEDRQQRCPGEAETLPWARCCIRKTLCTLSTKRWKIHLAEVAPTSKPWSSTNEVPGNCKASLTGPEVHGTFSAPVLGASVRNPARDKVMRKEADIRKACSDFRDPSGNS